MGGPDAANRMPRPSRGNHAHVVSTIDRRAVEYLLEQDVQLVDVLGADAYAKEHIAGAVNLPLATIAERAGQLDGDRPVIVYCYDSL